MSKTWRTVQSNSAMAVYRVTLVLIMAVCGCGQQTKTGFRLDDTDVPSAVFTPDSKCVIAGGYRRISLLGVGNRRLIDRFPEEKRGDIATRAFEVVAVSPDGRYVASSTGWRPVMTVRVWDLQTGRLVDTFDTDCTQVLALAFSPDGKRLAAGTAFRMHQSTRSYEGVYEIWLWNIGQKQHQETRFRGHEAPVQRVVFLRGGNRIASTSNDWTIRIWDVATAQELRRSSAPRVFGPPFGFPPPGKHFGGLDEGAGGWLDEARLHKISLSVSADERLLVCGRSVWDQRELTLRFFVDEGRLWTDFDKWLRFDGHQSVKPSEVFGVVASNIASALTPDGGRLVYAIGGKIVVFDIVAQRVLFEDQVFSNGAWIFTLDVSPDGRYALAGGNGVGASIGGAPMPSDRNQLYLYRLPPPVSARQASQLDQEDKGEADKEN